MLPKRIMSAALAAVAVMAFAGCSKTESSSSKTESSQAETQAQTEAQTSAAEATKADEAATTASANETTAEKTVPGKLYSLNLKDDEAPVISALKLTGNRFGSQDGINGWEASGDKIRFVFEQSEWIELYPQTKKTSGLSAFLVPHSDDTATYTDSFIAALNDDTPKTELAKPEDATSAWGSFYAHPEVNAPGYYDVIITSDMKPVAMVMVKIYEENKLSDKDDAALEQLMKEELSSFEQQ